MSLATEEPPADEGRSSRVGSRSFHVFVGRASAGAPPTTNHKTFLGPIELQVALLLSIATQYMI